MGSYEDTIFAPASGQGRAGIAVIRVSGSFSRAAIEIISGRLPEPRRATLRCLCDPRSTDVIDQGLVLWMPAPASFTGEDQAEFHIHGGSAVKAALLSALGAVAGCRPAEPGEFTRRAFLNNRIDLSAVEGLADLVDAETDAQRQQALRQAGGALLRLSEEWRESLIGIAARLEAALDFSDEADVPAQVAQEALASISALQGSLAHQLRDAGRGERLREGFVVVLAGAPNAGKSTLLNAIARRNVAIVSPTPGTTRDAIELRCDLDGLPVTFVDTAGLRADGDAIEREGIARARAHMAAADLVLWLVAPANEEPFHPDLSPDKVLIVGTKSDLGRPCRRVDLSVSAVTGDNLPELLAQVTARVVESIRPDGDALLTRERHRVAVSEASLALDRARDALYKRREELAAEDIRLAIRAVGRLSGRVDIEDVLDRIFAQFCIGK